jgi:hypothetical protein
MTYERGLGWGGAVLRAGTLALSLALGCGDDDSACVPPSLQNTCVAELSSAIQMCFDPQGSCTWADTDGGLAFEWKNGARYELAGGFDDIRVYSSDGDECQRTTMPDADAGADYCLHTQVGMRWVDSCVVRDDNDATKFEAVEYRCDNGRKYNLTYSAAMANANVCMNASPDLLHCVDKNGVQFGKQ